MSVYIVVQFSVHAPEQFEEYAVASRSTIAQYNGRVVARGKVEEIRGSAPHPLGAILEFPDREAAVGWYHSKEYQALVPDRDAAAETTFVLYNGFGGQ